MIEQINTMQAPPSLQIPVLQRTRTFKSHFPQHPGHVPAPPRSHCDKAQNFEEKKSGILTSRHKQMTQVEPVWCPLPS